MQLDLSNETVHHLDRYAAERGETVHQVADKVLKSYFAHVAGLRRDVQEAEAEADREGWLTTEQAFARLKFPFKKSA